MHSPREFVARSEERTLGRGIYFFADTTDNQQLCDYAASIGLHLYPPLADARELTSSDDPTDRPFCFLSPVPKESLHPYGNPRIIGTATDPLLEFLRSYHHGSHLVIGRIHWSDDVPDLAKETKPFFLMLTKWIQKHWEKLPDGQYVGPNAKSRMDGGAVCAQLPPELTVERRSPTSR